MVGQPGLREFNTIISSEVHNPKKVELSVCTPPPPLSSSFLNATRPLIAQILKPRDHWAMNSIYKRWLIAVLNHKSISYINASQPEKKVEFSVSTPRSPPPPPPPPPTTYNSTSSKTSRSLGSKLDKQKMVNRHSQSQIDSLH